MIRPVAHILGTLRSARLRRQRRIIAIERARLADLRHRSADLIAAQVARIAELEGKFLDTLPRAQANARAVAQVVERRAKSGVLA